MPKRHRHEEGSPEEPVKKQAKKNEWSLSQALRFPERLINWAADATASIIVSTDNYFNSSSNQQRVVAEENLAQPEQELAKIEALDLPDEPIEKITLNLGVNDMENSGLTSSKAYTLIYSENEYPVLAFNKGISLKEHYTHLENSLLIEAQYIRDSWQGKSSFHKVPKAFKHGSLLDAPFNLGKINEINRLLDECNAHVIKSKIDLSKSSLQLSDMGLTRFPQSLLKDVTLAEYWGALRVLSLSHNQLTALPAEIGNLQALKELYLNNNHLTALPADIGKLQKLAWLFLYNNQLIALPADIGKLQKLTWLCLNNNQLAELPVDIGNLQVLELLMLNNNHLTAQELLSVPERFREDNWLAGALVTQTLLSVQSPVIPRSPRP